MGVGVGVNVDVAGSGQVQLLVLSPSFSLALSHSHSLPLSLSSPSGGEVSELQANAGTNGNTSDARWQRQWLERKQQWWRWEVKSTAKAKMAH